MRIKEILHHRLAELYSGDNGRIISEVAKILEPEIKNIVNILYDELLQVPEIAPILENTIVHNNLSGSLDAWLKAFLKPREESAIQAMIARQKEIGVKHANVNVNLNFLNHGIGILKREIYKRLREYEKFREAFLIIDELFDLLVSIMAESYFAKEMIHETNELSLKVKGISQNTAIECERLRTLLFDWLRNALTFLYQTSGITIENLPKLEYSNFGLWVIYKADLLSFTFNVSDELKKHIQEIDNALSGAAECRIEGNDQKFFNAVSALNDTATKASWFISSIVEQALELDSSTDSLTRLLNRRYLETILRRQTDISMKQGFPYSILVLDIDHFKKVNDEYGHDSGDAVLKQLSEMLLLAVRTSDFVFRYGGEEFLIILGNAGREEAFQIAEKIRHKCEQRVFNLPDNKHIKITCSAGIAVHEGHPDYNMLIKHADLAVYKAKEGGRNKTIIADNKTLQS